MHMSISSNYISLPFGRFQNFFSECINRINLRISACAQVLEAEAKSVMFSKDSDKAAATFGVFGVLVGRQPNLVLWQNLTSEDGWSFISW